MAKVIMRYEITNYRENVMEAKRDLEAFAEKARANNDNWWDSIEHDRYDHACDRLEEYINFDAPYYENPDADYIYVNALDTEDGEELIGW